MLTQPTRQSESSFQDQVVVLAKLFRWRDYHTFDSRRSNPGFPDLVLVRDTRLVFAELKSERGKVRACQQDWLAELAFVPCVETYLWRPSDWDSIVNTLR